MIHDLLADSIVKPQARCGMPRMRTHKQDSTLLFLDYLHADDMEVADMITTFYVRRCVYFAFFGKPARPGPVDRDETRDIPGEIFLGRRCSAERMVHLLSMDPLRTRLNQGSRLNKNEKSNGGCGPDVMGNNKACTARR